MKNKGLIITLIVLLSVIVLCLLIIMFNLINGKFNIIGFNNNFKENNELVLDETYEQTFNNIIIDMKAGNIEVKNSEDSTIKLKFYGEEENIVIEAAENLNVKIKQEVCKFFCFNQMMLKIEIYIPQNYEKKLTITNNFGNINISKLNQANIKITNKFGDVTIKEANKLNIKTNAGDVKIGKVYDAIIDNDLGDIKIKDVLNYVDINSNCGDVKIDNINLNKDSLINLDLGDVNIEDTNEIYIDAKTNLGDVKINNNYKKSDITLKIKNACGDVEIDN